MYFTDYLFFSSLRSRPHALPASFVQHLVDIDATFAVSSNRLLSKLALSGKSKDFLGKFLESTK
jgi:hypothetical protein